MNKDDLAKKLDSIQIPEIGLPGHREQLKTSLMSKGFPRKRAWYTEVTSLFVMGLFSRQPLWKTGIVTLVLIGIVVPLSLFLPGTGSDSVYASALNIVESSIKLQQMLNVTDNMSVGTESSPKTYKITTDYEDGSIVVTFPAMDENGTIPGNMKLGAFDEEGNPVEFTPGTGTIYVTVDEEGNCRTISVTFRNDAITGSPEKTP